MNRGDFKEGVLRFACSTAEIFEKFAQLNFRIEDVDFVTEVQHGVFLMLAAKTMFVLDFNYKCFYSYASYEQLVSYAQNRQRAPALHCMGAFQVRNQPFDVKFAFKHQKGRSVLFQDGYLLIMGRKEIETVLCRYKLLPEQGALVMVGCRSLNSGNDLLSSSCRSIDSVLHLSQKSQLRPERSRPPHDAGNSIRDYHILKVISRSARSTIFKVRSAEDAVYTIRQKKIESLEKFQHQMRAFQAKLASKYLLRAHECFLLQQEGQLYFNVVEECGEMSLEHEILQRQAKARLFAPKQVAFLLRVVFKGVIVLNRNGITHGNLFPSKVLFLENGFTKLSTWYSFNRDDWENDFVDACSTVFQCVTLTLFSDAFTLDRLRAHQQNFAAYPGLFDFLEQVMVEWKEDHAVNVEQLKPRLRQLYRILQRENVALDTFQTQYSKAFWIGYQNSFIVVATADSQLFKKVDVLYPDESKMKFSKYNMFAYDGAKTLYMTGAIR